MTVRFPLLCLIVLSSCGGSLTDEQRKKAKADIERNQIRKISDSQIMDAAFTYGRSVAAAMTGKEKQTRSSFSDSLAQRYQVKIVALHADDLNLSEKEKLILEAYTAVSDRKDFTDNVQTLSSDSMLYTRPVLKEEANGSVSLDFALGIRMSKKQIVLTIKN